MKNSFIKLLCLSFIALALPATAGTLPTSSTTRNTDYNFWESNYSIQALAGAAKFGNLEFDMPDSSESKTVDLSLIPQIGGAWGTRPWGKGALQFGLEATFLFGFQVDEINYITAGGSGLRVSIDASMWMFDLAGGAYMNYFIGKNRNVRLYVAGGPLLIYSDYQVDRDYADATQDDESESESAFGLGIYARTGLEFRIYEYGMLGLGIRGNWANLDFTEVGGSSDLSGLAAYITFTAGL